MRDRLRGNVNRPPVNIPGLDEIRRGFRCVVIPARGIMFRVSHVVWRARARERERDLDTFTDAKQQSFLFPPKQKRLFSQGFDFRNLNLVCGSSWG